MIVLGRFPVETGNLLGIGLTTMPVACVYICPCPEIFVGSCLKVTEEISRWQSGQALAWVLMAVFSQICSEN